LIRCTVCGSNYAGAKRNSGDYYACGSHLYRRGAGCGKAWYVPKDELEALVFDRLLSRVSGSDEDLQGWVDETNRELREQWDLYADTAADRRAAIGQLEEQIAGYVAIVEAAGDQAASLAQRVTEASAQLRRLRRLEEMEKPKLYTLEDIRQNQAEIVAAFTSGDVQAKVAVLREYVVELIADPETKKIEGHLIDPRSPSETVYRDMVPPRGNATPVYNRSVLDVAIGYHNRRLVSLLP
jgi:TolA-binding protein